MFETLIEIVEKQLDAAAKALGDANIVKDESIRNLSILEGYLSEYISRLEDVLSRGIDSIALQNYQRFIAGLVSTIEKQKNIVHSNELKVERCLLAWRELEKKRLSYSILVNREEDRNKKVLAKVERKQSDEFAARRRLT